MQSKQTNAKQSHDTAPTHATPRTVELGAAAQEGHVEHGGGVHRQVRHKMHLPELSQFRTQVMAMGFICTSNGRYVVVRRLLGL